MVATQDVARGELIIAETPLITRTKGDAISLDGPAWQQFQKLPYEKQAVIRSLCDFSMNLADEGDLGGGKSLEGILNTNCYGCGTPELQRGALYETISRFNHSCSPNCENSWDQDTFQGQVRACVAISVGNELCTAYVNVIAPRAERQKELEGMYGFYCDCPACSNPEWESSDLHRKRASSLDELITGTEDLQYGLQLAKELLDIYEKEGIHLNGLRARACYDAFQLCLLSGDMQQAKTWIEMAYESRKASNGALHRETLRMLGFMKNPTSHPLANS